MGAAKHQGLIHVGLLSNRLTQKMLLALAVSALLSWVLLCGWFLDYLGNYAETTYDGILSSAENAVRQAGGVLEDSGGDFQVLDSYLKEEGLFCVLLDSQGQPLYQRIPDQEGGGLAPAGLAEVELPGGQTATLWLWCQAIQRSELNLSLRHEALIGLLILNICVFVLAAVLLYLFIIAPIIGLRRTMRRYYETGEQPPRSIRGDEVGRLQNAFADLAGGLEQKEKAERRLIASISHDLKTPLTSVLGYSDRLRSASLPPEKQRQYLDLIYEKAFQIKSVVDAFDDYLDVGLRDTAPMRLFTAEELCARLRQEYEAELLDAGAAFQVECLCPEAQILCNWEHIRRLFGNLIGNSFQHSGASPLELHLQCRQEDGQLQFLFWDNGQGVPSHLLQQIFEPLYTSDQGRKVSGLGLSICKSIAKAHGGTISAENHPCGGLCLRVSFPLIRFS